MVFEKKLKITTTTEPQDEVAPIAAGAAKNIITFQQRNYFKMKKSDELTNCQGLETSFTLTVIKQLAVNYLFVLTIKHDGSKRMVAY